MKSKMEQDEMTRSERVDLEKRMQVACYDSRKNLVSSDGLEE